MVHSEVYLNKYVVSIAPFCTSACPDCSQNITNIENCSFFHMLSLFNISSIFPGGQLTPFAPVCGRPLLLICGASGELRCAACAGRSTALRGTLHRGEGHDRPRNQ